MAVLVILLFSVIMPVIMVVMAVVSPIIIFAPIVVTVSWSVRIPPGRLAAVTMVVAPV